MFFKAVSDTTIVGSIRASVVEETCIIERLIVDPRFQRRGIGGALLAHAELAFPNARRYELFTGSRSTKNIELYEKHGYARCREEALSEAVSLVYMQKLGTKP